MDGVLLGSLFDCLWIGVLWNFPAGGECKQYSGYLCGAVCGRYRVVFSFCILDPQKELAGLSTGKPIDLMDN